MAVNKVSSGRINAAMFLMIGLAKIHLQKQKIFRFMSLCTVVVLIFSALLIYLPKHTSAAITFDKDLGSLLHGSGCTGSMSFTTSNSAAANSKIIIIGTANAAAATHTVSVSGGGLSWHVDKYYDTGPNGGDQDFIASGDAPSGLASGTVITATFNNQPDISNFCYIAGSSFTGLANGTGNDGTNTGSTSGLTSWNGGSITPTHANDLIFGFGDGSFNFGSFTSSPTCNPSSGYTSIHCDDCNSSCGSVADTWMDDYQIVSTIVTYSPGGGFASTVNNKNYGLSVAYKSANAAPSSPSLSSPSSSASHIAVVPTFSFSDTDPDNDDIQFTINLFQSNCTTSVTTYSMASGQTGWSPTFNGTAGSGKSYNSSTAGSGVSFTPTSALSAGTTYCWSVSAKDPAGTNTTTTSGTQLFTTDSAPSAPSLLAPSNGQIGLKPTPTFNLSGTESDGDYLNYEIQICSTSNCSSVVRTICEVSDAANSCTGSQAGWASQSQQSGTAYLSGQTAIYNYQFTDLSPNTQYWWRASEIDPGGSNTWSSASSISSFTIENLSTSHDINVGGTVNVQGNVCFGSC